MSNRREQLKHLADTLFKPSRIASDCYSLNGNNQPPFKAFVKVYDGHGALRYDGESGELANSKDKAEEEAAISAMLRSGMGDRTTAESLPALADTSKAAVRKQAWLGDAAQEFVLGLLGTRERLTAAQMDTLSQRLLCNKALAEDAPEQLASETLTATHVEARLGLRLAQDIDILLETLLPALIDANPALHNKVQAAVAAIAA